MIWDHSEVIGLARQSCSFCQGAGQVRLLRSLSTCNCVYRTVFRACYARFRYCLNKEKYISKVCLVTRNGKDRKRHYERLVEDYVADFCLVSKRSLSPFEYAVFRYHFLLGADWRLCCGRLGVDRGTFFHTVYRIQNKLGRIFHDLRPYSLFPLDEYFAGRIQRSAQPWFSPERTGERRALEPPLRGPE